MVLCLRFPHTTQACLKRGIAVNGLENGSRSHRYFSGACRVPPHLLGQECWVLVSVLGWVQQQLPLVQHLGVQVHPARGIKQLRSFHTGKKPHQGYK